MGFQKITLWNEQKKVVFQGEICFLPLKEEIVKKRCDEYYQQEVCRIRKELMKRLLYLEIEEILKEEYQKAENKKEIPVPREVKELIKDEGLEMFYTI